MASGALGESMPWAPSQAVDSATEAKTQASPIHYPFLASNEDRKLRVAFCNYLVLHQFELARAVLHQLYSLSPQDAIDLLECILNGDKVNFEGVRRSSHMVWFCLIEYQQLVAQNNNNNNVIKRHSGFPDSFISHLQFELLLDCARAELKALNVSVDFGALQELNDLYISLIKRGQSFEANNRNTSIITTTTNCNNNNSSSSSRSPIPLEISPKALSLLNDLCTYSPYLGDAISARLGNITAFDISLRERIQLSYLEIISSYLTQEEYAKACFYMRFLDVHSDMMQDVLSKLDTIFLAIANVSATGKQRTLIDRTSQAPFDLRLKVYEALLGTENPFLISKYCAIEDSVTAKVPILDLFSSSSGSASASSSQEAFWTNFTNYVRINNKHVLECIVQKGLECIKERRFDQLSMLFSPPVPSVISKLAPLLVLLSWDELKDDITVCQKMMDALWSPSIIKDISSARDPTVYFACEELSYFLKLSWWSAEQIVKHEQTLTHAGTLFDYRKELVRGINMDRITDQTQTKIANATLHSLINNHSIAHALLPWLPNLDRDGFLDILARRPIPSEQDAMHRDREFTIICSFYAIHELLELFYSIVHGPRSPTPQQIQHSLDYVGQLIQSIPSVFDRLIILENIFSTIFLRREHIKSSTDEEPQPQQQQQQPVVFIIANHVPLIEALLHFLEDALRGLLEGKQSLAVPGFNYRFERFKKYIDEALWRLNLTKDILEDDSKDERLVKRNCDFVQLMLSSAETFISICLKKNDFERCKAIKKFFGMEQTDPNEELSVAEKLQTIHAACKPSSPPSALSDPRQMIRSISNYKTLVDLAIGLDASPKLIYEVLDMAAAAFGSVRPTANKDSIAVLDRFRILLNDFESFPLRSILGRLHRYPSQPSKLKSYLDKEARDTKALKKLIKVLEREEIDQRQLQETANLLLKQDQEQEQGDNANGEQADDAEVPYLGIFLQKLTGAYDILKNKSNRNFNIFDYSPVEIMESLVFDKKQYNDAEALASLYSIHVLRLVIKCCLEARSTREQKQEPLASPTAGGFSRSVVPTTVKNLDRHALKRLTLQQATLTGTTAMAKRYHPLDHAIASYMSKHSKVNTALACLLLRQTDRWAGDLLDYAIDLSKDFPFLQSWIDDRAVAFRDFITLIRSKSTSSTTDNNNNNTVNSSPTKSDTAALSEAGTSITTEAESSRATTPADTNLSFSSVTIPSELKSLRSELLPLIDLEKEKGDEAFYLAVIEKFLHDGDLNNALKFADKALPNGAPDYLLKLYVEKCPDKDLVVEYIPRIRDKAAAVELVFTYMNNWDLNTCIDLLHMCVSHMKDLDRGTYEKAKTQLSKLELFGKILQTSKGSQWSSWAKLADLAKGNPNRLVRILLDIQEFELARQVVQFYGTPELVKKKQLLTIEQNYILHIISNSEDRSMILTKLVELGADAVPVCDFVVEHVEGYDKKLFIADFMLTTMSGFISSSEKALWVSRQHGMKILSLLSKDHQARFEHLMYNPSLIVENLLMLQDIESVATLLRNVPSLQNDELLIKYAQKALQVPAENKIVGEQHAMTTAAVTASINTPIGSVGADEQGTVTKGFITISEINDYFDEKSQVKAAPSVTVNSKLIFTGKDPERDQAIRDYHTYPHAPSIFLAKSILDLCSNSRKAGQACIIVCESLSNSIPGAHKDKHIHIISIIEQLAMYAKLLFLKDPDEGHDQLYLCDTVLSRVELLKMIFYNNCGLNVTLSDLSSLSRSKQVRDKLIIGDHMEVALNVATKCRIDSEDIWEEWGLALLKRGDYAAARQKLKYCTVTSAKRTVFLNQILHILEGQPPVTQLIDKKHRPTTLSNTLPPALSTMLSTGPPQTPESPSKLKQSAARDFTSSGSGSGSNAGDGNGSNNNNNSNDDDDAGDSASQNETPVTPKTVPQQLGPVRFEEAKYYLKQFGTDQALVSFYLRHGIIEEACQHIFAQKMPAQFFVDSVGVHCLNHGKLQLLQKILRKTDPTLDSIYDYLIALCKHLTQSKAYHLLYQFQVFMKDDARAGLTCIRLFLQSNHADLETKLGHLEAAKKHFLEAMIQFQNVGLEPGAGSAKATERKPILDEGEIAKQLKTVTLQIDVTKAFAFQNQNLTLFDSVQKKCEIAELLLPTNFDLAFRVMHEFRLPSTKLYQRAIMSLARKKQVSSINDMLKNMKGTLSDKDWDEVVTSCIEVYANEVQDVKTAEKFIARLVDEGSRVRACILCKKFKAAYLIAVNANRVQEVQYIYEQAKASDTKGARAVQDMCQKFLARHGASIMPPSQQQQQHEHADNGTTTNASSSSSSSSSLGAGVAAAGAVAAPTTGTATTGTTTTTTTAAVPMVLRRSFTADLQSQHQPQQYSSVILGNYFTNTNAGAAASNNNSNSKPTR